MNIKYNVSSEAKNVLKTYRNLEILNVKESLSHDGYDIYGPKSNLWDLYIIFKNNKNNKITAHWHYEQWFYANDETQYYFYGNI
jgi:hypothetical protein